MIGMQFKVAAGAAFSLAQGHYAARIGTESFSPSLNFVVRFVCVSEVEGTQYGIKGVEKRIIIHGPKRCWSNQ